MVSHVKVKLVKTWQVLQLTMTILLIRRSGVPFSFPGVFFAFLLSILGQGCEVEVFVVGEGEEEKEEEEETEVVSRRGRLIAPTA